MNRDPLNWLPLARDIVFLVIGAGSGFLIWLRKRSARHWPLIPGIVEFGKSVEENNRWRSDIYYSYKVESEFYSGIYSLPATNELHADEQLAQWKQKSLIVRYLPRDPAVSVILKEDQSEFYARELPIS